MPHLSFAIESVEPVADAAAPTLMFKLRTTDVTAAAIHSVILRCQIRIEPTRRRYQPEEQAALFDLFGPPEEWSRSLRSMLWTHASVMAPGFRSTTTVEMSVPCTFDLAVAATKYFGALDDGEVPLLLLFSGTIFYEEAGRLQVAPIPWTSELAYRLPVAVWRQMIERYYPGVAWLCLRRELVDRLADYRRAQGAATFDQALESLLDQAPQVIP